MPGERQELMLRIIDLCDTVRKRGLDPFDIEVREFFDRLRELLPKLRKHDEFYLDIQAVLGLADVVFQQGEWVKHKSSMLYLDPLLILLKLHALPVRELADVLARSWHPIVQLESLSPHGIAEAKQYWTNLPSLEERWRGLDTTEVLAGEIARRELARLGILSEEDFAAVLDRTWRELKDAAGERAELSYWDFISERSFEETVGKAWLVSFLVSYGYATLELKPLEEEILLKPLSKPRKLERVATFSVPIAISRAEWLQRRKTHG
ncbi:MAG: hypothetical protein COT21_03065 [Hadesarchaea archaeon CG08_land_8_20_14_0_20_51_8]|nr:MAG: hypothetical protein COT21_03065 [Hadesarchaea archaeon CG08_land_8_20_14_0_20_51_8]